MPYCNEAKLTGWCCKCYANQRARANYAGHFGYRQERKAVEVSWMPLKIACASSGNGSTTVSLRSESAYLGKLKNVMEFLLSVSPEGELLRQPGSLQVFIEAGRWKARLKDRQERAYCFVSSETLDGLLKAVDSGLESGNLDWRPDNEGGPPKQRK